MEILRIRINFHGTSSCTYNKILRPLTLRSIEGKSIEKDDSTNFASDIINTSIFPFVTAIRSSNLFLMDFILMYTMIM